MRSWPPLWESFQRPARVQGLCWELCTESYLPRETASQGLTLHNPNPPISHCITGSG